MGREVAFSSLSPQENVPYNTEVIFIIYIYIFF